MASIERLHRTAPLDLAKLEEDVVASVPALRGPPSAPMPDYVEHQDGVTRVGALTAEAVVRDYEAAAKEIEAMGLFGCYPCFACCFLLVLSGCGGAKTIFPEPLAK